MWAIALAFAIGVAIGGAVGIERTCERAPTNAKLTGRVINVIDGDTLTVLANFERYRVRLSDVDAPNPDEPWGNRASLTLAEKVFARTVRVEIVESDDHGRIVGTVWLGDRNINREMVKAGAARAVRDGIRDPSLREDEAFARASGEGLWRDLPEPAGTAPH
jgi:micrococcal nuclease